MKPIYIAAYHQSVFGKLMGMSVPAIVASAVNETCGEIGIAPSALDVASQPEVRSGMGADGRLQ